jgi:hypothetical protein
MKVPEGSILIMKDGEPTVLPNHDRAWIWGIVVMAITAFALTLTFVLLVT